MANYRKKDSKLTELRSSVEKYEILSLPLNLNDIIGEGSFSRVYFFMWKKNNCAIKMFKKQFSDKKVYTTVSNLVKLCNDNIVQFVGYSLRPCALVFEYCSVKMDERIVVHTLRELISEFNDNDYFEVKERIEYCRQANAGLVYLHAHGICHRDIKPDNMLVTGELDNIVVKICDFGDMATLKGTYTSLATTTSVLGGVTVSYLAPELCYSRPTDFPCSADIYALGITIFEVLSDLSSPWEKTFSVINDAIIIEGLKNGVRPSFDCVSALYKEDISVISKLISKCWTEDKDERPSSAQVCALYLLTINFP